MESLAGLDVGVKKSALCVVSRYATSVRTLSRHRTVTSPSAIGEWLLSQGVSRVGLEAGAQSSWLAHELEKRGLSVTVMETRRQRAFGSYSKVKTDERDARLIGEALASGLYTRGHVRRRSVACWVRACSSSARPSRHGSSCVAICGQLASSLAGRVARSGWWR